MPERSPGVQMMHAAYNGYVTEIEELLNQGVDINARDEDCDSPLIAAVLQGHKHVVTFLLVNGADANYGGKSNWTPLHEALNTASNYYEDIEIVKLLLKFGADINREDTLGRTPLDIAYDIWPEATELLKSLGAVHNKFGDGS